jgi:hypothetical protein
MKELYKTVLVLAAQMTFDKRACDNNDFVSLF